MEKQEIHMMLGAISSLMDVLGPNRDNTLFFIKKAELI
jgi:hypothetical protein